MNMVMITHIAMNLSSFEQLFPTENVTNAKSQLQ